MFFLIFTNRYGKVPKRYVPFKFKIDTYASTILIICTCAGTIFITLEESFLFFLFC